LFSTKKIKIGGTTLLDIIALLEVLVEGIFGAQQEFLDDPKKFAEFEVKVHKLFNQGALKFIEGVLGEMDTMVCDNQYRKLHYDIQRHDKRTIITTVGDAVFERTLFKSREDGEYRYLVDEMIGLESHERFSEAAEAEMLKEAVRTSYREAAEVLPSESKITKTTVMNKVHGLVDKFPTEKPEEKKSCRYLFIEADEDHIAEQHGKGSGKGNKSFISRVAYVYDGVEKVCAGRTRLNGIHYEAGLYEGSGGIEEFWKTVGRYIRSHYETRDIERIYVSGDGASWIRAATEYIPESVFVLDRFHLMKYICRASNQMLDEADFCKREIYRMLNGNHRKEFTEYTDRMAESAENEAVVLEMGTYVLNNWQAIQTALKDDNVTGCSAEGHVSHLLSDRLSSRPMGWSQCGADRMSKLRAYVKNYGADSIIELVKYSRKENRMLKTGTDAAVPVETKKMLHSALANNGYSQARSYIDRIQASMPGMTARKSFSIRNQLSLI